jgi:thioredoxin reductase
LRASTATSSWDCLTDRIEKNPKITIWRTSEVAKLIGDEALEAVAIRDLNTDDRDRVPTTALFVRTAEPGVLAVGDVRSGSIKHARAGLDPRQVRIH